MQTRFILLMASVLTLIHAVAHAEPGQKIRWSVPLEYATQTDQISNTEVLPRGNRLPNAAASQPQMTLPNNHDSNQNDQAPITVEPAPESPAEDIAATEERLNNEVRVLWDEIEKAEKDQQQSNDIKILPFNHKNAPNPEKNTGKTKPKTTTKSKTNITADIKADKERIDAQLQSKNINNNKDKSGKDKTDKTDKTTADKNTKKTPPAPVVSIPQPAPKPVLTRKQVLEQEIAREKAALKSARTQLTIAQKRGNAAQVKKLNAMIKDRELNVQAISRELSR